MANMIDLEPMNPALAREIDAEFDALDLAEQVFRLTHTADLIERTAEESHLGPTAARNAARAIRQHVRAIMQAPHDEAA